MVKVGPHTVFAGIMVKAISWTGVLVVKMKDVAELAGVSNAAVSRYLNGGYISTDKAERIKEAIEQTGYVRSNQARALRTGSTKLIGVIVPKINSESISRLTAGIGDTLQSEGYQMLLADAGSDPAREVEFLELFQRYPVDAIILAGTVVTPKHVAFFDSASVPVVITGQHVEGCNCAYYDDFEAARDLATYVADIAEGPIAYIGATRKDVSVGALREDGFRSGLEAAGRVLDSNLYRESPFTVEGGYTRAKELLGENPSPAFIACATDMMAAGAIRALTEAGVSKPARRVSGFGDNQLLRAVSGGIITVHFGYMTLGVTTARMALDLIQQDPSEYGAPRQVQVGHKIVE